VEILLLPIIALIGATVQWRRRKAEPGAGPTADIYLVWWLVVAVGIEGLLGAGAHLFDGPATAEEIGYTRGNGGFQFENAMGDLSIAVTAIMCLWFRGGFWLAVITVLSIQYLGDAVGHFYYWIAEDNTKPGNIGPPLWLDLILPPVAWALYIASRRAGGDAVPRSR